MDTLANKSDFDSQNYNTPQFRDDSNFANTLFTELGGDIFVNTGGISPAYPNGVLPDLTNQDLTIGIKSASTENPTGIADLIAKFYVSHLEAQFDKKRINQDTFAKSLIQLLPTCIADGVQWMDMMTKYRLQNLNTIFGLASQKLGLVQSEAQISLLREQIKAYDFDSQTKALSVLANVLITAINKGIATTIPSSVSGDNFNTVFNNILTNIGLEGQGGKNALEFTVKNGTEVMKRLLIAPTKTVGIPSGLSPFIIELYDTQGNLILPNDKKVYILKTLPNVGNAPLAFIKIKRLVTSEEFDENDVSIPKNTYVNMNIDSLTFTETLNYFSITSSGIIVLRPDLLSSSDESGDCKLTISEASTGKPLTSIALGFKPIVI